jgi:hypothetical protein
LRQLKYLIPAAAKAAHRIWNAGAAHWFIAENGLGQMADSVHDSIEAMNPA